MSSLLPICLARVERLAIGLRGTGQIAGIVIDIPGVTDPFEFVAKISQPCGVLLRFKKLLQRPFVISQLVIGPSEIA